MPTKMLEEKAECRRFEHLFHCHTCGSNIRVPTMKRRLRARKIYELKEMVSANTGVPMSILEDDMSLLKLFNYDVNFAYERRRVMTKEGFITNILKKLRINMQLDDLEIRTIISALRKYTDTPQEPYYEVIYHDEYDNTEHRIMEPISSREYEIPGGATMREDHFELRFCRLVKEDKK